MSGCRLPLAAADPQLGQVPFFAALETTGAHVASLAAVAGVAGLVIGPASKRTEFRCEIRLA